MIRFMYGFIYNSADHGEINPMLLNTRVYGVAEKYGAPALKEHARTRFEQSLNWNAVEFPLVIEEVYGSTHSSVRGLRDVVVKATRDNAEELMKTEAFLRVLEYSPGFAADMVKELVERPAHPAMRFRCPNCQGVFVERDPSFLAGSHMCRYRHDRVSCWAAFQLS